MYTNLHDAEARVAAIYPIGMIGDPEYPPKWLIEFAGNYDNIYVSEIIASHSELVPVAEAEDFDDDKLQAGAFAEQWQLAGRTGFIVFAEICIRRYKDGSTAYYSGWGYVQLAWLYCETIDEVLPKTLALAERLHDEARLRAEKKAGA
jgi:hypothetical protein